MAQSNITTDVTQDPFIQEIQNKLVSQAEAISSSNTGLEKSIRSAIGGVKSATSMESERIASQFGRETKYAQGQAQNEFSNFAESRSGFGTQMVAFRNLVETTDKYLSDLDQRKNELILQNNAAGASKIADLEIKALEYKQQAQQQVFDNLLGAGAFGLQLHAEDRAGKEFAANLKLDQQRFKLEQTALDRQTEATKAEIALNYGVKVEEGDSLKDVVNKAIPQAGAEAKARLNKMLAETEAAYNTINKNKARADLAARVTELLVNGKTGPNGEIIKMTPSEAALQAISDMQAIGLTPEVEDLNNAVKWSQEAQEQIDKTTSNVVASTAPSYWEQVFKYLPEVAAEGGIKGYAAETILQPKRAWESYLKLIGF